MYINVTDFSRSIRKVALAWNTCGLLAQHRISLTCTPCCSHVQLFSGLFACLATWSQGRGMKRKEDPLPGQWAGRLQAGKGFCGLDSNGGSWEMVMLSLIQRRRRSCCVCFLYLFFVSGSKTAWVSWYTPPRFCCSISHPCSISAVSQQSYSWALP